MVEDQECEVGQDSSGYSRYVMIRHLAARAPSQIDFIKYGNSIHCRSFVSFGGKDLQEMKT
ncbi:hypothetical protein M5K25_013853 [Dendrobium thyrsiflorum]|uniref:Uncharacterized protein n=1 Tax=Dendrobium thyrsiflorum TaxID=117978 RepID=A0ABD0UUU8_DENTH